MSDQHAQDLYRCTPRETRSFIVDCLEAGVVPFVQSSPGLGKSSLFRSVANEFELKLLDERLSTRSPVDLAGIPDFQGEGEDRRATFTPFDIFPIASTPLPRGMQGWLLFLDEFNSGAKDVQAAAYKLILDKMTGLQPLHENVFIGCAGNLATDRAIVNNLSTAMQSRVIHIEMTAHFGEWYEDVAMREKYDERIIAFLNWKNEYLMDFKPDHQDKTFCCPRTWEFMNRLVKGKDVTEKKIKLYGGTITHGVANEFVQFTKVYANLTTIRQVLADPKGADVPYDSATRWAVTTHLLGKVDEQNFDDLAIYMNRYPVEFRVLFFRSAMLNQPKLRHHPALGRAMVELSRYLNADSYTKVA